MGASADPTSQELLQVVGDPLRWSVLEHLRETDLRVGDLVERTGRAQNVVSYHLGELRAAGLVSGRKSSADGRDTYYRFDRERFGALMAGAASALDPRLQVTTADVGPFPRGRRPRRVLFLCTGNSARSQIAEALTVRRSEGTVDARSAGSHPKVLHPEAVRVLAERGIDISAARTKHLDTVRRVRFDRVVTLCDKVKEVCPDFPGDPRRVHWSIADPAAAGGSDAETHRRFVATADEIEARVARLLADLRHEQEASHGHR